MKIDWEKVWKDFDRAFERAEANPDTPRNQAIIWTWEAQKSLIERAVNKQIYSPNGK